jgi:molecular chaperone GrpE
MTTKIESENDIPQAKAQDIEIEFLTDSPKKRKKKSPASSSPKSSGDKALSTKLKKAQTELEAMKQERDQIKEEYLRQAAEKDNLRKRLEREKNDYFQYALSDLLKDFLAVQDNLERALSSGDPDDCKSLRDGVELIYKQFVDVLKRQGVTPIVRETDAFDPRIQQAFMSEESEDVEGPTVGEEFQKGYMLHDRLLRPALVKVLLPKKSQGNEKK